MPPIITPLYLSRCLGFTQGRIVSQKFKYKEHCIGGVDHGVSKPPLCINCVTLEKDFIRFLGRSIMPVNLNGRRLRNHLCYGNGRGHLRNALEGLVSKISNTKSVVQVKCDMVFLSNKFVLITSFWRRILVGCGFREFNNANPS